MRRLFCYFAVLVCMLVFFSGVSFAEIDTVTIQNLQEATDDELAGALQMIETEMLTRIKAHVELDKTELKIVKGKAETLIAAISELEEDLTAGDFVWISSEETIATVNNKGQVKGISTGNAVITCAVLLSNGFEIKATCPVQVYIPVNGITANPKALTMARGTQTKIEYKITPEDATDKSVAFTSSDEMIATVAQDGTITAGEIGDCVISITAQDGSEKKLDVKVAVRQEAQAITVEAANDFVAVDKKLQLTGTVAPENADNKKIEWISEDESVATVDAKGIVTGVAVGTTTIIAKAMDGAGAQASFGVRVIQPMKSIIVEDKPLEIANYTWWKQKFTVEPEDTTNKEIIWTSSNEEVATVDENGKITAKSKGKCIITGKAADGYGAKVEVPVEIKGYHYVFLSAEEVDVDFETEETSMVSIGFGINSEERYTDFGNGLVVCEHPKKVRPVKPGSDVITVVYKHNGRITDRIQYEIFVAQSAFEPEE